MEEDGRCEMEGLQKKRGSTKCSTREYVYGGNCYKAKEKVNGHVLRRGGFMRDVMEGRMVGKRPRGWTRMGMIDELKGSSFEKMKRAANREVWKNWSSW